MNAKDTERNSQEENANLDEMLAQGERLLKENNFNGAIDALREAAERYSDSPLPHHDLSVVYLARLRQEYEHLEVWEELSEDEAYFEAAVREAEAALEIDDDFVPARNNLAMLFALRGWWSDAIKNWEISLSLQPDQSQVREEMVRARKHLS